jgi:N-acyl-D-amino-acid deacylase
MTSMNAEKITIPDRGSLKVGYWADVAAFDPNTIADKATYESPH